MKTDAPTDGDAVKALQAGFEKAVTACPDAVSEHHYAVADTCVRLRIVGRGLAQGITPPFDHLKDGVPAGKPGLTIDLWNQEETGVKGISGATDVRGVVLSVLAASPDDL